jgi:leucine dehydrogenase
VRAVNASETPDFDAHEAVRLFELDMHGAHAAHAIIAIHSTHLGPAVGGCRVWRYPVATQALTDALRLSRGMSYKTALAELPLGGGKAVIIPPPGAYDRRALFEAFGRAVDSLAGRYITAEDVGSSVADMAIVARQTAHVGGLPAAQGLAGGDPSPWTALGVFLALQAALAWRCGGRSLKGAAVAVQGAGAVGARLCRLLIDAGAEVTVADIDAARAMAVCDETGAGLAEAQDIHRLPADAFAPCALGAGLNTATLGELAAPIICGAANNQLDTAAIGDALHRGGKLFCPDYVVNAGGIIAVQGESAGESEAQVAAKIAAIPRRLIDILTTADRGGQAPEAVADAIARGRIGRAAQAADGQGALGPRSAAAAAPPTRL